MSAIPFSTICRHSNSPLHPHSKSSFIGFSQRNNIWQFDKEELKEPLTEQGCLLAFSLVWHCNLYHCRKDVS
ncbi:alpha-1,4 glucan phosphorylase L-2 isozyme, chloroplastic/amyloplastic [Trifolium repens]|nr:alpha-1,4 glucan phosphorylase L-2 isozyme, chloroplastic/amyloplastic [Trifolium repens]